MNFKKVINKIHLVLGLSSGIVVFIIAITGAIWTFESEISDWIYSYRTVDVQNRPFLKPSLLKKIAQPYFGNKPIQSYSYYGADKPVELSYAEEIEGKAIRKQVYMNPYSGIVLYVNNNEVSFFDIIIELHVNLMLGEVGKLIVDYATLIFLLLLISGIILWWPKNRAALKQRIKFKWKPSTKWKRKNYDLHNILGFYASWIVIFMAITGLAWAFTWMDKGIYFIASGGQDYKTWPEIKSKSDIKSKLDKNIEDLIYEDALARYSKKFESISIYFPKDKTESVYLYISPDKKVFYKSNDYYYDQRNGNFLHVDKPENFNNGQKVRSLFYDIHIGKILGLPGQFLVFFASLIVASLPVSGFLIWWGRRNKKRKVLEI